jgi:hypothetical protein
MSGERTIERKNLGLIYDLLIRDGSITATGLAAMIAGGAALGALGALAIRKIESYFAERERDLEQQLADLREAREQLEDVETEDEKSVHVGAHEVYR